MALLPNIPAVPARRRRRKIGRSSATPTPPVGPPVLVGSAWDVETSLLTLTFDRAVEVVDMPGDVFRVFDGFSGIVFYSTGEGTRPAVNVYVAALLDVGESPDPGVTLDAVSPTHVFAVDGGAAWVGVADLALPFG